MVGSIKEFDAKDWVKVRSSLDGTSTFLSWAGSIYAVIPGEKRKLLFQILGLSVGRCIADPEGGWDFTSRELNYYLDPKTGEIIHKWQNPWTEEILPVIHVANNPVQGYFKGVFPARVDGENTTFVFDLFPTYPNPLGQDAKFSEYSPNPIYQAAELFKLTVPTEEIENPDLISVSKLLLSWDRIGPWLPWMKMGNRAGYLIYSATGRKISGLHELPEFMQNEINTRLPLYKNAPLAKLDTDDMSSWLYFQQHFDAYLAGEIFPIPQSEA